MNPLIAIVLLLFILLPSGLFVAFWMYIRKRGWGSKWLLAVSLTLFMSLFVFVLWLGYPDNFFLLFGLGIAILGGISFFLALRKSPMSDALIGTIHQIQNESNDTENSEGRKQSTKLIVREIIAKTLIPLIPLIIGFGIMTLPKGANPNISLSLGLFVAGFTGVLRIFIRPKHSFYSLKSNLIGNLLLTFSIWALALYSLLH